MGGEANGQCELALEQISQLQSSSYNEGGGRLVPQSVIMAKQAALTAAAAARSQETLDRIAKDLAKAEKPQQLQALRLLDRAGDDPGPERPGGGLRNTEPLRQAQQAIDLWSRVLDAESAGRYSQALQMLNEFSGGGDVMIRTSGMVDLKPAADDEPLDTPGARGHRRPGPAPRRGATADAPADPAPPATQPAVNAPPSR